jgi:hypothetical protein
MSFPLLQDKATFIKFGSRLPESSLARDSLRYDGNERRPAQLGSARLSSIWIACETK